jgi:hypothetical protein
MDTTEKLWVKFIVESTQRGDQLCEKDHQMAIRLIDAGLLGMDGWRYMPVEEARENWRRCHKS